MVASYSSYRDAERAVDFLSDRCLGRRVRATRYDVMADEEVADDASQILSQQPASGS